MKKLLSSSWLLLFIVTSCKKENAILTAPEIINIAPVAFAGVDFSIGLPTDSATLSGTAKDTAFDILEHGWRKISGPRSYVIESPQLLRTKVRNLEEGIYEFELTATDNGGLTGKDTVTLTVHDLRNSGSNEIILKNLKWIFPWGPAIEVKNINSYPAPQKVFLQRSFDPLWIEVSYVSNTWAAVQYEYFIETRPSGGGAYTYGSLYVFYYGSNTVDTPNVKIQF